MGGGNSGFTRTKGKPAPNPYDLKPGESGNFQNAFPFGTSKSGKAAVAVVGGVPTLAVLELIRRKVRSKAALSPDGSTRAPRLTGEDYVYNSRTSGPKKAIYGPPRKPSASTRPVIEADAPIRSVTASKVSDKTRNAVRQVTKDALTFPRQLLTLGQYNPVVPDYTSLPASSKGVPRNPTPTRARFARSQALSANAKSEGMTSGQRGGLRRKANNAANSAKPMIQNALRKREQGYARQEFGQQRTEVANKYLKTKANIGEYAANSKVMRSAFATRFPGPGDTPAAKVPDAPKPTTPKNPKAPKAPKTPTPKAPAATTVEIKAPEMTARAFQPGKLEGETRTQTKARHVAEHAADNAAKRAEKKKVEPKNKTKAPTSAKPPSPSKPAGPKAPSGGFVSTFKPQVRTSDVMTNYGGGGLRPRDGTLRVETTPSGLKHEMKMRAPGKAGSELGIRGTYTRPGPDNPYGGGENTGPWSDVGRENATTRMFPGTPDNPRSGQPHMTGKGAKVIGQRGNFRVWQGPNRSETIVQHRTGRQVSLPYNPNKQGPVDVSRVLTYANKGTNEKAFLKGGWTADGQSITGKVGLRSKVARFTIGAAKSAGILSLPIAAVSVLAGSDPLEAAGFQVDRAGGGGLSGKYYAKKASREPNRAARHNFQRSAVEADRYSAGKRGTFIEPSQYKAIVKKHGYSPWGNYADVVNTSGAFAKRYPNSRYKAKK